MIPGRSSLRTVCRASILLLGAVLLAGCSLISLPSQTNPICSWSSNAPRDADTLCRETFTTIATVLRATVSGDRATVRHWVVPPTAARKILAYGAYLRAQGHPNVHAVAAPTLQAESNGRVFVVFNIVGHTAAGKLSQTEAVTLERRDGRWLIVVDERHEAW